MLFTALTFVATSIALASAQERDAGGDEASSAMVDDLNDRFRSGRPSDDYADVGALFRVVDTICTNVGDEVCELDMSRVPSGRFFGGTELHPDNLPMAIYNRGNSVPTSAEYGEEIYVFHSWTGDQPFGPAAALIYFPCAVEASARCLYPHDSGSDFRPTKCGRMDFTMPGDVLPYLEGIGECDACLNENFLSSDENTVDGTEISYLDDIPSRESPSADEIELLFNRQLKNNLKNKGGSIELRALSDECVACQAKYREEVGDDRGEGVFNQIMVNTMPVYEAPGYYGEESGVTEPKNELKKMLEVQLKYFGPNHDYSNFPLEWGIPKINEIELSASTLLDIEAERTLFVVDEGTLDYDGRDGSGKCVAGIKALVVICDGQQDPFYYGERGTCLDWTELYQDNFGSESAPPVVYFDPSNLSHPFSVTCDRPFTCGAEATYLRKRGGKEGDFFMDVAKE